MGIVGEPKLLLLDEPLSNLDAGLREEMRTELLRLQRTIGITTVYVTHDQTEALTLSDRIAVVDRGRILQVGPPTEIYLRPQSEFVARFVGSTNMLYGKAAPAASPQAGEGRVLHVDVGLAKPLGCIAPAGIGSSGEAAVSVRPEAIEIALSADAGNPAGDVNELRGEIAASTFMGVNLRYDVRVAERVLSVITPPRRVFGVGDKVVLRFSFESAVAVPPAPK
jgi:iron(III) transport system ATP-binding protein